MTALTADDQIRIRWIILLGVSLANFVGCIVNTAIADIQRGLAATMNKAQWIVTAFVIALSGFMVVSGRLEDRYATGSCSISGWLCSCSARSVPERRSRSRCSSPFISSKAQARRLSTSPPLR